MALYSGVDIVAVATMGNFTETYGSTAPANIANLFASYGLLEDAPNPVVSEVSNIIKLIGSGFKKLLG